ncbi:Uncharacterized membrane protein [Alteromonadaceae bacterium Bs31]|nr:Uncharacterized membrane protein [Alteromonadaceae bacterium Bs31]
MSKPVKPIKNLAVKTKFGVLATALSYSAILLLFTFWHFSRESGPNWVVYLLQSLPLLLLLPGLVQKYYRSYSWLCFLMLIYFVKAVDGAFMSTANWSDFIFVALTSSTFIAAMMASRWLQRLAKV